MIDRLKYVIICLCLFVSPVLAQTGSSQTATSLNSEINSNFADNNSNAITAKKLRQVILDLVASGAAVQSSTSCPPGTGLTAYQLFSNTTGSPTGTTVNIYDGAQCIQFGTLNQTAHFLAFTQAATNNFFSQNNAVIDRLNDRVFIGGATANDGAFPFTNLDWYSSYVSGVSGLGNYLTAAMLAVSNNNSASASSGAFEGAHSLHFTSSATAGIANSAVSINDNATLATTMWAYYGECHNATSAVAACLAMELDPTNHNLSSPGQPDPFQQGSVVGIQDACGAGLSSGINACHVALQIVPNTETFQTGINFMSGSVSSGTGAGSTTAAISLPSGYDILWDTARSTFGGSIHVNSSKTLVLQSGGGFEWLNSAGGTDIFDCYVATNFQCTVATQFNITNSANLLMQGGASYWATATNNDSFAAFDNAGTWTFQHAGSTIDTISSSGLITANGGVAVTGGNTFTAFSGGGLFVESAANNDNYYIFDNSGTFTLQHSGTTFFTATSFNYAYSIVNTGSANTLVVDNAGTVSNASTQSSLQISLSAAANTSLLFQLAGGASPNVLINTGSNVSGMAISPAGYLTVSSGGSNNIFINPGSTISVLGSSDGSSAVNVSIHVQNIVAGNANTASGTLTIQGALSNGSGTGGDIIFTTTNNSAGSGVQNTASEAIRFTAGTHNIKFRTSSTGASTQTFTNTPCSTSLTTAQWIPVEITGQSGTWFIPACH